MSASNFDAAAHMRKIRTRQGMQDYLDVKWRIMWLRSAHPDASIITEETSSSDQFARFKATISFEVDGRAVIINGHGSETAGDFGDFYEKAETKAIGRACAVAGYGTDAASDFDDGVPMDGAAAAKGEADRKLPPADRRLVDSQDDEDNTDTPQAPRRMDPEERERVDAHAAQRAPERNTQPAPSNLPTTRQQPQPNGAERARAAIVEKCAAKGVPVLPDDDNGTIAESINAALARAGSGVEVHRNPDGSATAGAILTALMALPVPAAAQR
jgi:hypothetical protein